VGKRLEMSKAAAIPNRKIAKAILSVEAPLELFCFFFILLLSENPGR
jgi:hypothetical protein